MITKAATDTTAYVRDLIYTKSARDAWKLILNSIKHEQRQANILLPSYIGFTEREGSGIFDPVQDTASQYSFYEMNKDLSINLDSLEKLIQTKKFNVLLVVHYFGFCRNDLHRLKAICETNNIILIEDCAHAFHIGLGKEQLGVEGDFSFYSVHKHLPVENGGILKNITKKVSLLDLPEQDCMSAKSAIQLLRSDYEAIASKRRANFRLYKAQLGGIEGIEIMYDLHDGDVPQSFPIRVKEKKRESLYFYLMDKGMPTIALYYRLIDALDADKYPLSHTISQEILNLPVHQDTTEQDIKSVVMGIKDFFELGFKS